MSFTVRVLTRSVSDSLGECELTFLDRVPIDLELARAQHAGYEDALRSLGATVERLSAPPAMPDAPFVEDILAVVPPVPILCRPGAASRRGEAAEVASALEGRLPLVTLPQRVDMDGGDVLWWGTEVRVGVGGRTHPDAVEALHEFLGPFGYRVRGIAVTGSLHLKTAATVPGPGRLLLNQGWLDFEAGLLHPDGVWRGQDPQFPGLEILPVSPAEPFGANTLALADRVLLPVEHPRTARLLEANGLRPLSIPISEFLKAEAGVTCLCVVIPEELFLA